MRWFSMKPFNSCPMSASRALLGAAMLVLMLGLTVSPQRARAESPAYQYALNCLGCHTLEGVSPPLGRIPPLRDVVGHFTRTDQSRYYLINVPGIKDSGINDAETSALLNWLVETYGGDSVPQEWQRFEPAEIAALRRRRPNDIMAVRAQVREELSALGFDIGYYP